MNYRSDFHVHTNLSRCAPGDTTLQSQIDGLCDFPDGLDTLGISNHLWDSSIPGASNWYKGQDVPHVLLLREEMKSVNTRKKRILLGAEVEMASDCDVCITRENARLFDYLLITVSHFHMKGLVISPEITDADTVRELLIKRFIAACKWDSPVKCGICHPFYPMSFYHIENEILSKITDAEYEKCFNEAKKGNKSIEIHASILRPVDPDENGIARQYARMLRIARECGCSFHIGSDVHKPNRETGILLRRAAEKCGIDEERLTEF